MDSSPTPFTNLLVKDLFYTLGFFFLWKKLKGYSIVYETHCFPKSVSSFIVTKNPDCDSLIFWPNLFFKNFYSFSTNALFPNKCVFGEGLSMTNRTSWSRLRSIDTLL